MKKVKHDVRPSYSITDISYEEMILFKNAYLSMKDSNNNVEMRNFLIKVSDLFKGE